MWRDNASAMGRAVTSTLQTTSDLSGLARSADQPQNGAVYPYGDLSGVLKQTARLVRARVGTQVVTVDFGSWDHHTDLGTVDSGEMEWMVRTLAGSLAGFFTDLGQDATRVTVATISEFGRSVSQNGSAGTEHGHGNCMLLLGAGVKGGRVHGSWPGLARGYLDDGDLAVTTDYRSVLAEVVGSRFPAASLPAVFPRFTPTAVGVMA